MGEMADYHFDAAFCDNEYESHCDGYWTTKEGTTLRIKDMETSHIQNCLKMLNSEPVTFEEYIFEFEEELRRRGVGL